MTFCKTCNSCLENQDRIKAAVKEYKIPFECPDCGMIKMPVSATLDRVLVWSDPLPETLGESKLIYIPERTKENYRNEFGTVLSVGPGYFDDKRHGAYTATNIKVGDRVVYDKQVLYRMTVKGSDGKMHQITLMGEQDVYGVSK